MTRPPVIPRYGHASLAELLPSVLASLGDNTFDAVISLPDSSRICVLLVDGLGLELLQAHRGEAPFLSSLLIPGQELTAGFPSTTATNLSSLGTGRAPGVHGLLGLEVFVPELGRTMSCLRWDDRVDPATFQPLRTVFELAAEHGVAVTRVGPGAFDGTGLTEASLRGGRYLASDRVGERVAAAATALGEGDRSLVYVYYGDLDATGHAAGCDSEAWRYQLAHTDRMAEQLAAALPPDGLLLITADHGMVDVPPGGRTDVAGVADLIAGVRVVSGEPRAVYVHAEDGAAGDVLAAWGDRFADVAWVVSREEAVDAGWFGPSVMPSLLPRIGDVIVAAREPVAVFDSRFMAPELFGLIGMHGSLTAAEQLVPLLRVRKS